MLTFIFFNQICRRPVKLADVEFKINFNLGRVPKNREQLLNLNVKMRGECLIIQ